MQVCVHGDKTDDHCYCDAGWFDDDCTESLKQKWTEAFYTYQGCFLFFFLLMFIFSLRNLINHLDEKKQLQYKSGCAFICSVLNSPISICIILCNLISIIKLVWLAIDPLSMDGIFSRVEERILGDIVYSLLFAIYGILLIVWFTIYDEVSFSTHQDDLKQEQISKYLENGTQQTLVNIPNTNKKPQTNGRLVCHCFKATMKIRIILVIILQITMSVLKGLRLTSNEYRYHSYVIYGILYINFVIFIIEFAIYGFGLYNCINNQLQKIQQNYQTKLMEVQREYVNHFDKINALSEELSNKQEPDPVQQVESSGMNGNVSGSNDIIPIESGGYKNVNSDSVAHSSSKDSQFNNEQSEVSQVPQPSISFQNNDVPSQRESIPIQNGTQRSNLNDLKSKTERKIDDIEIANDSIILDEEDCNINWSNKETAIQCANLFKEKQRRIVKEIKEQKGLSQIPFPDMHKSESPMKMNEQERKYAKDEAKSFVQSLFSSKREHLNIDKRILAKIMIMAFCGIFLEICFGVLSVIIFVSTVLQTPIGTITVLYIAGVLELVSLYLVLKLFQDVKSKEIENLIWIKKLGNKSNHITEKYLFKIPQEMHAYDRSKTQFELRINQISSLKRQTKEIN